MARWIKYIVFAAMVGSAYGVAWLKAYQLSADYFDYAEQQYSQGHKIEALKGMNKLELRREQVYRGGYQQVVEAWEGAMLGPKPAFYDKAKAQTALILTELSTNELLAYIEMYVELDMRYVPEAALQLRGLAAEQENRALYQEMDEFLREAFPVYYEQAVDYSSTSVNEQPQTASRSATL